MIKNIGIDVDGVLNNMSDFILRKGKGIGEVSNPAGYDVKDIFGCTKEVEDKFWIKNIWEYCISEPPRALAKEVIRKWKQDGHKIVIITGRVHVTEENAMGALFRHMLLKWLEKNGIEYDEIVYCSSEASAKEKLDACREHHIDIMLEDKRENIEALSPYMKVICFDAPYNLNCQGENIVRVHGFDEAYHAFYDFRKLSLEEKQKLSPQDLIIYFKELRDYYAEMPYPDKLKDLEKNYQRAYHLGMPLFNFLYRPQVIHPERIPQGNGYIFVSNHLGSLDQFPIQKAIGDRPIHFMAASTLEHLARGFIYRHTGCLFVDRENPCSRARCQELMTQTVLNDSNIFIFPEGTRNNGRYGKQLILPFKLGAAAIAQITQAPIVPFAVTNHYEIFGKKLLVRVGNPFTVNPTDDLVKVTANLQEYITSMVLENNEQVEEIDKKIKKLTR